MVGISIDPIYLIALTTLDIRDTEYIWKKIYVCYQVISAI